MKKIFKKIEINKSWWKKAFVAFSCLIVASTPLLFLLNNQNNTSKVMKVTENIDKEKQIEIFEDLDMKEVDTYLSENNVIEEVINNSKSFLQKSRNANIIDEIDVEAEILESIEKVQSGEILIADLENDFLLHTENNNEYKEFYDDWSEINVIDSILDYDLDSLNTINNINYSRSTSWSNINSYEISGEDLYKINKIIEYKKALRQLIKYNNDFMIVSWTLTAVAWGVATWYWSAWWWFGANIPPAICATLQAVSMTIASGLSQDSNNKKNQELRQFEKMLPTNLENEMNDALIDIIKKHEWSVILDTNINFAIDIAASFVDTLSSMFRSYAVEQLIKNAGTRITNLLTRSVASQTANSIVIKSTSWANPIGHALTFLDLFISMTQVYLSNNLFSFKIEMNFQ